MQKWKMMMLMASVCGATAMAQPAMPEIGKRWVVNGATSDEFNGEKLDSKKWYNADPRSWRGRPPGLFEAEAVSVSDGKLHFTVDELPQPVTLHGSTFTHRGAHVYSTQPLFPGSYVECSMKANKTFMSSTFWLITNGRNNSGCDKRTTELDIQECIGYPADNHTSSRMGSNTHSRGIPEGCAFEKGSVGNNCKTKGKVYDDFHTYAVWWKSPTELLFYLDGEHQYTIVPKAPFDLMMDIKLVCETYDWSKVPEDGGMTGSVEDRTTSYDWVRSYTSIPVDMKQSGKDAKANKILTNKIAFTDEVAELYNGGLNFKLNYQSNRDSRINLELIDQSGKVIAKTHSPAYAGYGSKYVRVEDRVPSGTYRVVASLKGAKGVLCDYTVRIK